MLCNIRLIMRLLLEVVGKKLFFVKIDTTLSQYLKIPVSVVLAHQEYEAWFLASAASLAGVGSLPDNLEPHPNPESKTGAKEWLNARMTGKYLPTRHQPTFTKVFDLRVARTNADSFDKCCRDIERLCKELEQQNIA
jgi:Domain of unknown function (DUF4276)